jgi:NADPH:quinone reductase-like Zn-dependent oxidoreductase
MATHRAWVQAELGGKLELQDVETPTPSAGEVLVDVLATPINSNAADVLTGNLFPLVHPMTLGISAVGRIAATGSDNTSLKTGQLVFCNPMVRARDDPAGTSILQGWFGGVTAEARKLMEGPWRNGAWAQKMVVPMENVVPLSEERLVKDLGYEVPRLLRINELLVPFGGWLAADLKPGSTVIVAPATGHFGGAAVQVALGMGVSKVS